MVNLREHQQARAPAQVLLDGDADYAVTGSDILIHRSQGAPLVALAAIFQHSPYALLVRADAGIETVKDLAGKRIMLGPGVEDAALHAMLRRVGLTDNEFQRLASSFDARDLINDKTDAFNAYITDQGFLLKEAGVQPQYLVPRLYGVDFYGDILATTEKEIENNPDRVSRFREATLNGWAYALSHPEEMVDLIHKKYNTQGMSRAHLLYEAQASRELIQPLLVQIGHMNPDRWQHIKDIFVELQLVEPNNSIAGLAYKETLSTPAWVLWVAKHLIRLLLIIVVIVALLLLLTVFQMRRLINQRTSELADSERRYRTIFNAAPEGMWVIDPELNTLDVNERLSSLLGYSREEMIGKQPMTFTDKTNKQIFTDQVAKIPFTDHRRYDIELQHRDGHNISTHISAVTVRKEDSTTMAAIAFVEDITARKAMEASLRLSEKNLRVLLDEVKQQKDHLEHLAHHDSLTNLPNRILFLDRLELAISKAHRSGLQVAVLFVDLDRFKEINDTLGHEFGDRVLKDVSRRFRNCIREDDTVARLGGDEFTFISEALNEPQHAAFVAQKLIQSLESPFIIDNHPFFLTASIGISLYPQDGESAQTLLRNADAAMYKAKEEGKNTFQFYTENMTEQAFERMFLEASLRHGLKNNELVVYYQLQVNAATREITGIEALVRWLHPELGLVSPGKFIPLAEETGLIIPLGEQVMAAACKQMAEWRRQKLLKGKIAVNLSVKQISSDELLGTLKTTLMETGCKAEWLELEVTEGFLMKNPEKSISIMQGIRELGVELAIDDFGIGYSSLAYLKRFPITRLKIDRSFIRDVPTDSDDNAITRAVIALGRSLNLRVIAEGVENEEQKEFLIEEGCEEVQGYLFSRPVSAKDMTEVLRSW